MKLLALSLVAVSTWGGAQPPPERDGSGQPPPHFFGGQPPPFGGGAQPPPGFGTQPPTGHTVQEGFEHITDLRITERGWLIVTGWEGSEAVGKRRGIWDQRGIDEFINSMLELNGSQPYSANQCMKDSIIACCGSYTQPPCSSFCGYSFNATPGTTECMAICKDSSGNCPSDDPDDDTAPSLTD